MKLASLKSGRDGKLVVVSTDLAWYASADMIAPTLQAALDNWDRVEADLRNLATDLDHEVIPRERFHERLAAAPLPRAFQWADGSAYVNHVALVRQARGAEMPDSFWHDPLMYQGGSDGFLGPRDAIPLADEAWGCDLEGEVVVVTGDVPLGASREEALAGLDWKKPKPLASSPGIRLRRLTSLVRPTSRIAASASSRDAPSGTSPVTTTTSPSRSQPQASSASGIASRE